MDLIAQHQLDKASQIYYCVVKSVNNNQCTIIFNNKQYTVPYYGGKPTPNKTYAIFLPHNNMNESFVIGDGKDGGGGGSGSGIAIQPDPPTDGELVWIDTDDPGTTHIIPEIDDTQESEVDTWSSQKIASEISSLTTPTMIYYETTTTQNTIEVSYPNTPYTVHGNGFLICCGYVRTDTTSDTGTAHAIVSHTRINNGANYYRGWNMYRLQTAQAQEIGTEATGAFTVSDGDTVNFFLGCSKNGTKRIRYTILCFGCTLS